MIATIQRLSVRGKVIFVAMVTAVIGILAVGATSMIYQYHTYRDNLIHEYTTLARIVANRSSAALAFGDAGLADENLRSLAPAPDFAGACIYDAVGEEVARHMPDASPCPGEAFEDITRVDARHVHVYAPILLDNERIGAVYLRATTARVVASTAIFIVVILGAVVVVIMLSYLMSKRLQRIVSDPIAQLAEVAQRVSAERDYSLRAAKAGDDDVGQLVATFNDMLGTIEVQNTSLKDAKKNLEALVAQRTGELQRANEELRAFSYSVSHDLRAPLRAINGFATALTEDYQAQLDNKGRDYLARVCNAAANMGELIDALLALSRMSNQEMKIANVDLTRIAQECIAQLQADDPARAVEMRIAPGMTARGDPTLLTSVLQNLIGNAWKYTRDVEHPRIEIGAGQQDGETHYFVRDNGAGFDMQYSGKLFGAFQRLHHRTQFEGVGIGLATVARIVHRHGGRVWAAAAPGAGATFYFTLDTPAAGAHVVASST